MSPSSPINQQINQARALSAVGARILQQHRETLAALAASTPPRSQSSPISRPPSSTPSSRPSSVSSAKELRELPSPILAEDAICEALEQAANPSPAHSNSSRFTYPMSLASATGVIGGSGMVRSNTQSGGMQASNGLSLSKISKEEDGSCKWF